MISQWDKLADVSVEISSRDLSLSVPDFVDKVSGPMAVALAEKINAEGLQLVKDIPYFSGIAGTTPADLADFFCDTQRSQYEQST